MKHVKTFAKTCYSEILVAGSSPVAEGEREDGSLIEGGDKVGEGDQAVFHGGLGLKFKFPGDPRKSVLEHPVSPPTDSILGYVKRLKSNSGPPT